MYNFSNNKYAGKRKTIDYEKLLKNTAEKAKTKTEQAQNGLLSVTAPSWISKKAETNTYGNESISSDNLPGLESSDTPAFLKRNKSSNSKNESLRIKNSIAEILSASTGKDYSKIFDGIDDKLVETNISLADDTVKMNTQKRAYLSDYPNMRDGMALFYAAAESGDRKAAKLARRAAYLDNIYDNRSLKNNKIETRTESGDDKKDRYVVENSVNFRSNPGTQSSVIASLPFGTKVKYTGNKTDIIGNYRWAEVEYNGKKGWIADTLLGIDDPIEAAKQKAELERQKRERIRYVGKNGVSLRSDPHTRSTNIDVLNSGDFVEFTGEKIKSLNRLWAQVVYNGKTGWVEANDLRLIDPIAYEKSQNLLKDHQALRNRFATVKGASKGIVGDYDDLGSLECVDLSKWFVNEFTTLNSGTGHGKDHVNGVIANNMNKDLRSTIIPCAPAVYSVAAGKPGPGLNSNSHSDYGHTGVIIDVKRKYYSDDPYKDKYDVTYFHAWDGCAGFSQINTKEFSPSEDVTYLDLSKYMK